MRRKTIPQTFEKMNKTKCRDSDMVVQRILEKGKQNNY